MKNCKDYGYKVGDQFEVVSGSYFTKGSVVELRSDDGTFCPLFKLISGGCYKSHGSAYEALRNLRKIDTTPQSLQAIVEGSGLDVTIGSDGNITIHDLAAERVCVVGSIEDALSIAEEFKKFEQKIGELGDWRVV